MMIAAFQSQEKTSYLRMRIDNGQEHGYSPTQTVISARAATTVGGIDTAVVWAIRSKPIFGPVQHFPLLWKMRSCEH